ncbi:MAG: fumarylacetoacetate hydrolase family protein [Acidobacteria bacterium]|nr:fumarylacetoacetate hydrolase family protein [Acidobacteriota bacterium]MBV9070825.1 fumarylacetoacetate hydrolase family protein [Acidobacteriota bacterium]MBV9188504.1 fumarylacetoacetate hydrolase family protein [Acidobacteriota bacterium]
MKIYRFVHAGKPSVGVADGDRIIRHSGSDAMTLGDATSDSVPLADAELLAPVTPSKIVAVGRNYAEHARELGNEAPSEPIIFLKPPSAVLDPAGTIVRPPQSQRVDFEGELAIVIGKTARNISRDDWRSVVLGFTCANDVTARDLQKKDVQFTRGKSFDTFLPLGPCIETDLDPAALSLRTRVNGETKQNGNTHDMVFGCGTIIEFITAVMTLHPGDVILTGTPSGVGPLNAGDRVEVEIEGIGVLSNQVS